MTEIEKIKQAIQVLETQRAIIGHDVVDAALGPLREKLAALKASTPAGPAVGKEDGTQRRIITALFADVSGFTAMSEQMDAEDVRDTMNALWQRLDAVILANGGKIDKHMGGGARKKPAKMTRNAPCMPRWGCRPSWLPSARS
jgi:class 3 adenylate cyclase